MESVVYLQGLGLGFGSFCKNRWLRWARVQRDLLADFWIALTASLVFAGSEEEVMDSGADRYGWIGENRESGAGRQ